VQGEVSACYESKESDIVMRFLHCFRSSRHNLLDPICWPNVNKTTKVEISVSEFAVCRLKISLLVYYSVEGGQKAPTKAGWYLSTRRHGFNVPED
jgi:hypothetical protein